MCRVETTSASQPRRRPGESTRRAMLDAALPCFVADGDETVALLGLP
jgi:hypothetical protein